MASEPERRKWFFSCSIVLCSVCGVAPSRLESDFCDAEMAKRARCPLWDLPSIPLMSVEGFLL